MATTTSTAPAEIPGLAAADKNFMDSWYAAVKDNPAASRKYTEWGTALAKIPTYDGKLARIQKIISETDPKYKSNIPPLAVNWLVESNPGIVDSKGDAFSTDFYKGIISGDTKTRTANSTALKTAKTKVATESAKLANPKATPAELATIVADIVNGSSTKPYNPATLTTAASSTPSASLYKAGSMSADKLKSTYGNILDPDTGKALFSEGYLKKVASATTASGVQGFNDTLSKVASKVLASQTGSNYLVQSDADKADALTNLLKNPETLASGTKSLYDSAESKTGINGLLPVGSFKDDKGNFVYNGGEIQPKDMSKFVQTYNNQEVANRGAYVAPTYNTDTKMYESKSTSPYASALTSLLGSTKNPFASDYKSSLAQPDKMTSTQLANISKPFKENTTARDIINLQNSAGLPTDNELTKGSSLSKNLLGLYQTNPDGSAINSPWVADTDQMVIPTTTRPEIDTSTELVQLDPGGLLHNQGAVDPNLAANQATAILQEHLRHMPAWQRAGFNSQGEADAAGKLGISAEEYYKSQRATGVGIDTLAGGSAWTPELEKLYADHDVAAAKYYKWTPDELAKYLASGGTNYNFKAYGDNEYIPEGASLAALSAPRPNINTKEALTPPVVTPPVVTNTSGVNPGTPEEIEARRIATDKSIAEQQAAEELRKKDLQQKMSQFSLTKVPETETSQPFNAGIVTPNINNVVSKESLNTNVKGTNGESSIVDLLKTPTSQPIITASPTGPYYNEQDQARSQAAALAAQQGLPVTGVSSQPSNSGIISLVNPNQVA